MNRSEMYRRVQEHPEPWDMIIVGGGATGVGVAIDAASRGYDVVFCSNRATSERAPQAAARNW